MSPWPPEGEPTGKGKEPVTLPRPGHADLAGVIKYGLSDVRNALERRECASHGRDRGGGRRGEGAAAHDRRRSREQRGHRAAGGEDRRQRGPTVTRSVASSRSGRRASHPASVRTRRRRSVSTRAWPGRPWAPRWSRASRSARGSAWPGCAAPRPTTRSCATRAATGARRTVRVIEAGVSNGEEIVVRAAMKPLPTLMKPLRSADLETGEPAQAFVERFDVAAVEALAVVAEACVTFESSAPRGRSSAGTPSWTSSGRGARTWSGSPGRCTSRHLAISFMRREVDGRGPRRHADRSAFRRPRPADREASRLDP